MFLIWLHLQMVIMLIVASFLPLHQVSVIYHGYGELPHFSCTMDATSYYLLSHVVSLLDGDWPQTLVYLIGYPFVTVSESCLLPIHYQERWEKPLVYS